MTIKAVQIIKPYKIKVNKIPEPRSSNPFLPPFFYNALFIGFSGAGKSYKFVELLKLYERDGIQDSEGNKMGIKIILFSPTANSTANSVLKLLKIEDEDKIAEYSDDILEEKINEIIEEQKTIKEWNTYVSAFKKFHKYNDVDSMTDDELELLDKYNGFDNDEIPRRKQEKVYFIIFDDLVGTSAFSNKRKSKLNNLVILCRHFNINIIVATQHIKAIPPVIRSNTRVFCIFKSNNYKKLLDNIYSEVSGIISLEKFVDLYHFSTQNLHDCLTIIIHNSLEDKYRIRRNWNEYLSIEDSQ